MKAELEEVILNATQKKNAITGATEALLGSW